MRFCIDPVLERGERHIKQTQSEKQRTCAEVKDRSSEIRRQVTAEGSKRMQHMWKRRECYKHMVHIRKRETRENETLEVIGIGKIDEHRINRA